MSDSVPKMVLRNVTVQMFLRIVSAVAIPKPSVVYRMVYIVIFKRLAGIPYVALLVRPMVYTRSWSIAFPLYWFDNNGLLRMLLLIFSNYGWEHTTRSLTVVFVDPNIIIM